MRVSCGSVESIERYRRDFRLEKQETMIAPNIRVGRVRYLREGKERCRWEVQTPTVKMHSPAKNSQFHSGLSCQMRDTATAATRKGKKAGNVRTDDTLEKDTTAVWSQLRHGDEEEL